jgi:hypothetical protein
MIEFIPSKDVPDRPLDLTFRNQVVPFASDQREVIVRAEQVEPIRWKIWSYKLRFWQVPPLVEIISGHGIQLIDRRFWHYPQVYSSLIVSDQITSDELTPECRVLAFALLNRDFQWRQEELHTTVRRVWWTPVNTYDPSLIQPPESPKGGAIRLRAFPHAEVENQKFRKRIEARNLGLVLNPLYSATYRPELPEFVSRAQAAFNVHPANRKK